MKTFLTVLLLMAFHRGNIIAQTDPQSWDTIAPLTEAELYTISMLTSDDSTIYFENGDSLTQFLKLEIVSHEAFLTAQAAAVNHIRTDTNKVRKENGVTVLKCGKETMRYEDNPVDNESRSESFYVGQVPFLHQYIMLYTGWEEYDYSFIDQKTCKATQSFSELPLISNDKRHIISLYTNIYENTADLSLYRINKDKTITEKAYITFTQWMPAAGDEPCFWSKDGYFYTPVLRPDAYWNNGRGNKVTYQYVRIQAL